MRIAAQALAVIDSRVSAERVVAQRETSSTSASSATKPTHLTNTTSPFASVLQSMGSAAAVVMRQTTATATAAATAPATAATPAISTESADSSAATLAAAAAAATAGTTTAATTSTTTTSTTGTTAATTTKPADSTTGQPGISALITAIQNGSFTATNVTDPTQLTVTTPWGNYAVSSFYYASDDTANQLATLLGGTVVQLPPFGQTKNCVEPLANFIQLPNGQTVNAASLALYAQGAGCGTGQLAADLTQTINEGAALTNYYQYGGPMPMFQVGYTGPAITGMTYPAGTVAADGTVINPAMGSYST